MQYRENIKNHDKLSALGLGFMRLPKKGKKIDREKSIELVKLAYESGINYYDTAYVYLGGESEIILGEAVKDFRDKIKLTNKLPIFSVNKTSDFDKFFNTSLDRMQTHYIDYYLMHAVSTYRQWCKMKDLGVIEWLESKVKSGEIINIGFSFHGRLEDFLLILEDYPWDFTQIQYNFIDIKYQAGTIGLDKAYELGIPVIIMEPLRGGMITDGQPPKGVKIWENATPKRTLADWGLRWVWNHKAVTVVLSGMSTEEMIKENIETVATSLPDSLTKQELEYYEMARTELQKAKAIGCTGCKYCMPCPKGVDIPACFMAYNAKHTLKVPMPRVKYITELGMLTDTPHCASLCVECGLCESKCPQNIEIRKELKKVRKSLEFPFYIPLMNIGKKIFYRQKENKNEKRD